MVAAVKGKETCAVCGQPCNIALTIDDDRSVTIKLLGRVSYGGTWPGELSCTACPWTMAILASNIEIADDGALIALDVDRLG